MPMSTSAELAADPTRLARVLRWLSLAALGFAGLAAIVAIVTRDLSVAALAFINLALGSWLLRVQRVRLLQGQVAGAALATATGLLGVGVATAAVLPEGTLAIVGLPLLAVALALPYLDQRVLRQLMVASWAFVLLVAMLGEIAQPRSTLPLWSLSLVRTAGVAAAAALTFSSLWFFGAQLRQALDRAGQANDALRDVQDQLRQHVGELEQRNREMTHLAELGELLESCQNIDEAAAVIARIAGPLFGGDAGALYELTNSRDAVEAVAVWGDPPPVRRVFSPADCWALRRGRLHVVRGSEEELRCAHLEDSRVEGAVCAPLSAQSETLGVLHLQVRESVSEERLPILLADRERLTRTLAEQLELALANFRLRETLREQSTRDQLTGLFNRRFMEESLERELLRARREGYSLGLLMMDLDHFKQFNDGFGHAAGDLAIHHVGSFLLGAVRGDDVACRYGGEEFVVILPKASLEDTRRLAETLREGLKALKVKPSGLRLPALTVSVGVACSPDHGETREQLLQAADSALYRAKAGGRDQVAVASVEDPQQLDVAAS
jgi:diguanylate cyclase (GGDEF)-like protein